MQFFTSRKHNDFRCYNTNYVSFYKDKNNYYCNTYFERASYELPKK